MVSCLRLLLVCLLFLLAELSIPFPRSHGLMRMPNDGIAIQHQATAVKVSPTYRVTFSLISGEDSADSLVRCWPIKSAIDRYIRPLLDELQDVMEVNIDSQVRS
eukprot:TRINITY_DN2822_c0_g1_i3.p2 TRINITY_DN2822_c0_g1~~TRINITY_DN2822_c0_g1_i3.p2  ORF type:complete len:104 (+),score=14.20 TRINITY_DN2822_c0_g1_i3:112-423(+)